MMLKDVISAQLANYEKSYEETKDFEVFKANIHQLILDMEAVAPVSPSSSYFLFHVKLDCENMERSQTHSLTSSLKRFLDRL